MKHIYRRKDGSYTFAEKEAELNENVVPAKFSIQDKYASYRQRAKKFKKDSSISNST